MHFNAFGATLSPWCERMAVTPSYDLLKGGVTLEIEEGHIKRLIQLFPILHWEDYSRGGGNLQKLGVMLSYPYVSLP